MHDADRADRHRGREDPEGDVLRDHYFLPLTSAPSSSGSGSGTVSIHSPSLSLSWSSLAMLRLGVLVLGAPEQRVERAHLDADPAVHAERVVDVEAVEHAHAARSRPPSRRGGRFSLWPSM